MLLDPRVERRKFAHEVALLEQNAKRLQALGVWLVRVQAPTIDLMFVPRHPLRVGVPYLDQHSLILTSVQKVQLIEHPSLSARPFGARLDLSGYDQQPPSVTFHDPWTWQPATYEQLPIGQLVDDTNKRLNVLLDGHPICQRPFLCLRGVREYHDHPQHDGDDWAVYRSSTNAYVLVERIAQVALHGVRPLLLLRPSPGQLQIQLNWAASDGT